MKRINITLICTVMLMLIFSQSIFANDDYNQYAERLNELGLFKGTSKGYELDEAPTRTVGAVMLIRLLGKEEEVLNGSYSHPFTDVPSWANNYIGYMYENELTKGLTKDKFGANDLLDVKSYMTFVLRALRYDDSKGDFNWSTSLEKGKSLNLMTDSEVNKIANSLFLRGNMVRISYMALNVKLRNEDRSLREKLYEDGAITTRLINGADTNLHLKYDENTGLYGYVDKKMNWIIKPKFFSGKEFNEGLAFVVEGNGDRGYISKEGKYVFEHNFEIGTNFSNGKAITEIYDKKDGKKNICVIDKEGSIVQKIKVPNSIEEDEYGLKYYKCNIDSENAKYYFTLDSRLIDYPIGNILEVHNEDIIFSRREPSVHKGLFNKNTGKVVIEFTDKNGELYPFQEIEYSEGIYRVQFKKLNKKYYAFYNSNLNLIINEAFRKAKNFSEGVVAVGVKKDEKALDKTIRFGYLDKTGSWFIKPRYIEATSFKDSIAIVRNIETCEVINRDGTCKVEFERINTAGQTNMTQEELDYVNNEADKVINKIINESMNELEKVKAINKYIVEQTKYDNENYSVDIEKLPRISGTPYGVFKYGIAVCGGYALATKLLFDKAGLENKYIVGRSSKEPHAWNLVKVDGKYYHIDTTWNDSSASNGCNAFFLVSDGYMTSFGNRAWNFSEYPIVPEGYFNDEPQPHN
ncbi:hypothetical protein AN1V17_13420 [Vallitalea sediminicola]